MDNEMSECKVCFAQRNGINSISVTINELCEPHYRDWSDEKNMGEYL